MQVSVKYDDLYKALEPLKGLKLSGSIQGKPISKFPLRELVELLRDKFKLVEEYRGHRVVGFTLNAEDYVVCHFGLEEPDDFCIAIKGEGCLDKLSQAALKISKIIGESYTLILSAIVHALQGLISSEEESVEEIEDPDQVIEELLVWLPEYVQVVE